jgi:hypothetical protein
MGFQRNSTRPSKTRQYHAPQIIIDASLIRKPNKGYLRNMSEVNGNTLIIVVSPYQWEIFQDHQYPQGYILKPWVVLNSVFFLYAYL